ncbi:hypothetical protein KIW84_030770 [Lathyrus oleraceus]|uniref:Uncharacterized protein n=1 Tax=Pisum sativum TaxID=3888 RepID=A0A9D4XQK3_PEA|nr:hypothetical protein KIW84_030770 [Pisum sativum]
MVNPLKSYIFAGFVFEARLHHIANQLGFKIGRLPFSYLGVPIFKVKPKARHLRPLLDKVISKLSNWKGSFLSFKDRIQLVKSYVASMLVRFRNSSIYWKRVLNQILIEMAFIGNITSKMVRSSIHEFTIIKYSNVKLHPAKVPRIIEVIWRPPDVGWLKCNTDNSFSTNLASCRGLFRNSLGDFVFGFANMLDSSSSIQDELLGVIKAIDFASSFGWNSI